MTCRGAIKPARRGWRTASREPPHNGTARGRNARPGFLAAAEALRSDGDAIHNARADARNDGEEIRSGAGDRHYDGEESHNARRQSRRPRAGFRYAEGECRYAGGELRYAEEGFRYAGAGFRYAGAESRYAGEGFRYATEDFRYARGGLRYAGEEFRYAGRQFRYAAMGPTRASALCLSGVSRRARFAVGAREPRGRGPSADGAMTDAIARGRSSVDDPPRDPRRIVLAGEARAGGARAAQGQPQRRHALADAAARARGRGPPADDAGGGPVELPVARVDPARRAGPRAAGGVPQLLEQ